MGIYGSQDFKGPTGPYIRPWASGEGPETLTEPLREYNGYMSRSLNSLKGLYRGLSRGTIVRVLKEMIAVGTIYCKGC